MRNSVILLVFVVDKWDTKLPTARIINACASYAVLPNILRNGVAPILCAIIALCLDIHHAIVAIPKRLRARVIAVAVLGISHGRALMPIAPISIAITVEVEDTLACDVICRQSTSSPACEIA